MGLQHVTKGVCSRPASPPPTIPSPSPRGWNTPTTVSLDDPPGGVSFRRPRTLQAGDQRPFVTIPGSGGGDPASGGPKSCWLDQPWLIPPPPTLSPPFKIQFNSLPIQNWKSTGGMGHHFYRPPPSEPGGGGSSLRRPKKAAGKNSQLSQLPPPPPDIDRPCFESLL